MWSGCVSGLVECLEFSGLRRKIRPQVAVAHSTLDRGSGIGMSKCSSGGFGDGLVLLAFAAADANCADDLLVIALQGDTACEDHDAVVVGGCDAVELLAVVVPVRRGRRWTGRRHVRCRPC